MKARETTQRGRPPGWLDENDQPGQVCLMMMDASEGVPYRLAEPESAKPVIESKVNISCWAVISGELQARGNSICLWFDCVSAFMTPRKETLDSLHTFSS